MVEAAVCRSGPILTRCGEAFCPFGNNPRVVGETEFRELVQREPIDLESLGSSDRVAAGRGASVGDEDDGVAGFGVNTDQAVELDLDAGFLEHLTHGGLLDYLASVNKAGGEGPATKGRGVVATDEQQLVLVSDDHASGELGVSEPSEVSVRASGAITRRRIEHNGAAARAELGGDLFHD